MGNGKGVMVLIVILALIVSALGIMDILLYKKFSLIRDYKLPQAMKDLEDIRVLKVKLKELDSKIPPEAERDVPPDMLGFLEAHARRAGIPRNIIKDIKPVKEGAKKEGPWKESSYAINITTTKEERLSRSNLVEFLLNVERERPLLKTRDIVVQFTEDGSIETAQIYISYFKRS